VKSRITKINTLRSLKRIGCIIPADNTVVEPMLNLILHQISDRVSVHVARVPKAENRIAQDSLRHAAATLQAAAADVIIWFLPPDEARGDGAEAVDQACRRLVDEHGITVIASSQALQRQVQGFGMDKVAQVTDLPSDAVSFERLAQIAAEADTPEADCLVIDSIDVAAPLMLDELEHYLKKLVLEPVTASVHEALRAVGVANPLHGWGRLLRIDDVVRALDAILHELRVATSASRTTIRLDVPHLNIGVDDVYAESVGPDVSSLKLDSSLNQRSLATVQWMDKHKKILVQNDCIDTDVPPPNALIGVYGVKAQVLGPLFVNEALQGWISVHYIPGIREWTDNDINALQRAMDNTDALLRKAGWF